MNRVAFLVDGFNVYHSLRAAQAVLGRKVRWLDLHGLCASYVHSSLFGSEAVLGSVIYFSAFATFFGPTKPGVLVRHRAYVRALEATGVDVAMGRFKPRQRRCTICGKVYLGYEEKETDVAIAVRIVELALTRGHETIIVVTGDTDIIPALRAARRLAPDKQLWVASPFQRYNRELRHSADAGLKIRAEAYLRHQLPDPVIAPDGSAIPKPPKW